MGRWRKRVGAFQPYRKKGLPDMRMVFGKADEEAFHDARERLVTRFAEWAEEQGRDVAPFVVACSLDFKWGYSDGRLGYWTTAVFQELLCEWFPRKVTLDEFDWPAVVPALHAWVDYLQAAGLRDQRGDGPFALHQALDELSGQFPAAMGDVTRYGMAKFWATTMADHGVDPGDQQAVQRFIAQVQEGQIDYDDDALSAVMSNGGETDLRSADSRMPPVRMAPEDELATHADENLVVRRIRALTDWVGDGRALTQTGRLKLADARHLIDLLGTSDVMDPVIGSRTFKTSTSEELYELDVAFRWAKAARTVRVVKGRLVPVKKNARLLDRPLELWERAFTALEELGEAVCGRGYIQSLLAVEFELGYHAVLTALYTGGRLPRGALNQLVWDLLCQAFWIDHGTEQQQWVWRKAAEGDLRRLTDQLELLGAIRQVPEHEKTEAAGETNAAEWAAEVAEGSAAEAGTVAEHSGLAGVEHGEEGADDELELTPLGVWGARRKMLALGYDAPVVGDLAGESAEVVVAAAGEFEDFELADEELATWCTGQGEGQAARELTGLIRRTDEPQHRMLAFHALGYTGQSGIEEMRALRDDPCVGACAGAWLVSRGAADPGTMSRTESSLALVETLAATRILGDDAVVEALQGCGPASEQEAVIDDLWRVPHHHLDAVLTAVAESHPDKKVAKAARKARFKARSRSN